MSLITRSDAVLMTGSHSPRPALFPEHTRHSLLYTGLRFARARLHLSFQSDQVFQAEVRSARCRVAERIGSRQTCPTGRKKAQPTRLVPIVNAFLSPLPAASGQLQRLLKEWMEGMRYTETSGRIVPVKRI